MLLFCDLEKKKRERCKKNKCSPKYPGELF